ncbi:MAG TPA: TonB family protein [Candidatus Methylomirabilis sp.]|nr:TonB family protein [Candidatus Methylomirabilis sp.]
MVAAADRYFVRGPRPREVWLTVGLSLLLHGLLTTGIILVPHFRMGTYIRVPVTYTVNLVDLPPGGRAPAPATGPAAAATVSPTVPPVAVPRPAPSPVPAPELAPRPVPGSVPTEELTLPGRQTTRKPPATVEPSLRPPSVTGRESPRTVPSTPAPIAPAAPMAPVPVPAPTVVQAPAQGVTPSGAGKGSGVEVAGTGAITGVGVTVLASYLTLVDWKIQQNWIPMGMAVGPETIVVVRFRVFRSGQVRDVELESTSGNASLDASALRAIRQSLPLPPFPNLLTEPSLDLRYRFVMERG